MRAMNLLETRGGVLALRQTLVGDAAECVYMQPATGVRAHHPRLCIWVCRQPIVLERFHS